MTAPPPASLDVGDGMAGGPVDPLEIDRHHLVPRLFRCVGYGAVPLNAGTIHQDIQAAELPDRLRNGVSNVVAKRDVGLDRQQIAPGVKLGLRLPKRLRFIRADRNPRTAGEERPGDPEAPCPSIRR